MWQRLTCGSVPTSNAWFPTCSQTKNTGGPVFNRFGLINSITQLDDLPRARLGHGNRLPAFGMRGPVRPGQSQAALHGGLRPGCPECWADPFGRWFQSPRGDLKPYRT